MIEGNSEEQVHISAIEYFERGIAQNPFVQKHGRVEKPIPIHGPEKDLVSWFVGITISDSLVGFIQFDADFNLLRYSSFQRDPSSLDGCPKARSWLDPNYIKELSKAKALPDEDLAQPFLSYDKDISRIAWVVKAKGKNGHERTIFVAGEFVYVADQDLPHS